MRKIDTHPPHPETHLPDQALNPLIRSRDPEGSCEQQRQEVDEIAPAEERPALERIQYRAHLKTIGSRVLALREGRHCEIPPQAEEDADAEDASEHVEP